MYENIIVRNASGKCFLRVLYCRCDLSGKVHEVDMSSKNKKKKSGGTVFLIIGVVLLLIALGRSIWYVHESRTANEVITEVAVKLDDVLPEQPTGVLLADEIMQEVPEREMPVVEVDGCYYIGKLEVPSIGLELPIMESWDYSLLKIAPCRYSGSVYTDDMIIAGHNYRKHFSPLKWVDPGTEIIFTDAEGNVYHYEVASVETFKPTEVEKLLSQEEEDWDLTLFTCNTGGRTRCILRCDRVEE